VGPQPTQAPPRVLAVPNVIAYPSTASVPITVCCYDGRLLCGYNVAIKWLKSQICPNLVKPPLQSGGFTR